MKNPSRKIKTDILIIGAGPAGMATAMELSKSNRDFLVVERSSEVGGLSKTYSFKEGDLTFYTDNGPHRFFSKNPYLYEFIEDLLHEDWIKVARQTRQFIDGKFYDYPVNAMQALKNLGLMTSFRMGFDYLIAKIQYGLFRKPIINFEDYVVANFGRSLGEFSMINYTEKIWGIPSREIHPDWATQRIKGLNLFEVLKDTLGRLFIGKGSKKAKSLVDTFYYPEKGTGLIYETIRFRLEAKGYKFLFNTTPVEVRHAHGRIREVILQKDNGETILVECNSLVESVPITQFIKLLSPSVPLPVLTSSKVLRHRSQVYLFITLDKDSITKDQWIYFPAKDVPIGRVSEMKNFSSYMSPPGKTSLFVEFFCFEGDAIWKKDEKELFDYAMPYLEDAGFFTRDEVRKYYLIRQKNVYPIYDLEYKKYLADVKKYLDGFKNLYYIGRPGRFRYNNQDHSLEMGILAAKSLIDGKRYDIEAVGEEKEYFEGGKLHDKDSDKSVPPTNIEKERSPLLSLLAIGIAVLLMVTTFFGIRDQDTGIYVDQINYYRGNPVSTNSVDGLPLRAFKPFYATAGLILPFLEPINVIILLNGLFMLGLIYTFYYFLRELGFSKKYSLTGVVLLATLQATLRYGFTSGTDISGWFFCIASMLAILVGIRTDASRYIVLGSLLGFLGATSKETGVLGLLFGGIYILLHTKDWGIKKTVKVLTVLSLPFFVLEGIFLYILIHFGFPNFLEWLAFNKDNYEKIAHTLKFFFGGEIITFNILWLFVVLGLSAIILKKIEINKEQKFQLIALSITALPILKWPIFLERILNIQFFIIIPLALYSISYISSVLENKGFRYGTHAILTLCILSNLAIILLGGLDGIYSLV